MDEFNQNLTESIFYYQKLKNRINDLVEKYKLIANTHKYYQKAQVFDINDPTGSIIKMIQILENNLEKLIRLILKVPIMIQTWNINDKNVNTNICSLILGNKVRREREKGIYLFQEYNFSHFIRSNFRSISTNFRVEKDPDNHHFKLYYNEKIVMLGDETIGMKSEQPYVPGQPRIPHFTGHGDVICWNHNYFEFVEEREPSYWENSLKPLTDELGHRSTKWVILKDVDTDDKFAVLSIHASQNLRKAKQILFSILQEAQNFIENNYRVVIGGDFNESPDVLFRKGRHNFGEIDTIASAKMIGDKEKITHVNIVPSKPEFARRLDYIFVDSKRTKIISEKIYGINFNMAKMSPEMLEKGHDHGILQLKISLF